MKKGQCIYYTKIKIKSICFEQQIGYWESMKLATLHAVTRRNYSPPLNKTYKYNYYDQTLFIHPCLFFQIKSTLMKEMSSVNQ